MIIAIVVILGIVGLFALIVIGARSPRTGANLSRAGLLELQSLLEPERKVEILREKENKEELLVTLDDTGET
jgi:hypothetical protein